MTVAYIEGYLAFPDKLCPYEQSSTSWNDWLYGYTQAELVSAYYNDDGENWTHL